MNAARGKESLAVALDLPPVEARELGALLAGEVGFLKVGLALFCAGGPAVVSALKELGARVFLDLKLHDIPHTVAAAARAVSGLGIDLLTVHAAGGEAMVEAAVRGAEEGARGLSVRPPPILAVSVLTSLDERTLARIGLMGTPEEAVVRLARLAVGAGAGGIVCSPREAKAVRAAIGTGPLIVTPGIRPSGMAPGDQARAETPSVAMEAGADILVVGRPILQAAHPVSAARAILEEIRSQT